jgi:hypothetical protein
MIINPIEISKGKQEGISRIPLFTQEYNIFVVKRV